MADAGLGRGRARNFRDALLILAFLTPLALFGGMKLYPAINGTWVAPRDHFIIVSATAFVSGATAAAFLISIKSLSNTRSVFLGLGFVALALIFMSHGLATPNVVFAFEDGYLDVVRVSAGLSLGVCALLIALSVLPWDRIHDETLVRGRLAAIAGIVLVSGYVGFSLWQPRAVGMLPINETTQPLLGATVVVLLLFSAYRYWQSWRLTDLPAQFAMVGSLLLLAQAQVSMVYGTIWQADWWLYHVLLLAAFAALGVGWALEARRAKSLVVFARALSLQEALSSLRNPAPEALIRLERAMEERDSYTRFHMSRTALFATGIARELQCDAVTLAIVEGAARIHDIGKITVPDAVLLKPGALTKQEFETVKGHTARGAHIALSTGSLAHLAPIVRGPHERFGGGGYPDGLKGDGIPMAARIVAVADTFDALTSTRSYRAARPTSEALRELWRAGGTQLDPRCVEAFLRWFEREGRDEIEPDESTVVSILMAA